MTATFLNRSTTKFSLNGLEYAKVFLPVKVNDTHLKIVNVYDTRFQLLEATKFDQLQVDGSTFASLAEALSNLSGLVYSKVAVTGSPVAVSADAKNALVEGSDGGVYLDESLLSGGSSNPTELLSITTNWQSGLSYKPYAEWKHNGTVKSFSGERTADPADATYDRFDLFIINLATDTVEILKGTASANPEKPALTDPVNQLDTGIFISIKAGATTPDGVSGETVYAENATGEWSISGAGADFDVASPNSPNSGTVCIETLNPLQNGQSLIFSAPATIISEGKELSYKLKNKTGGDHSWLFVGTLAKNGRIGSVSVSAPNNYDPNLSTYQALSLPFPAELSEVSSVRIMAGFTGFEYHLDDVIIISGGGTVTSGVTKEYVDQGDADTLQAAKDYTDQVAGSGAGDSVKKRYLTWTALLADQAAQVDKGIYYASDASGHSTVDAEGAYFEYLGTVNGTEADYRKLSEEESMDVVPSGGEVISSIIPVTQNYLLLSTSNNALIRVKDYSTVIVPSGLGIKHRTVIKKATGKTVSLTAGENVVLETPSGYLAQVLAQNDAIEIVCEEITNGIEYWGVYGALTEGETLNGYPTAIKPSQTSVTTSLLWPWVWKSSDFPMITTTKEYFTIYSTDHASGDGGIYWGEMDDPEWNGFVERGLIKSGYQAESPWPVNKGGVLYLFYHTLNEPGNGTGDGSANIQETRLMTTTGGELHTATWTDKGRPLGLLADENHTGYLRVWWNGTLWVGHHLKTDGSGGQAAYSTSSDLENWTRAGVIDTTSGMPVGDSFSRFSIIPYTYNATQYGFIYHITSASEYFIGIAQLDSNFLPTAFIKDITQTSNLYGVGGGVYNDIGYVLFESGAASDPQSVFYLVKYYLPETA